MLNILLGIGLSGTWMIVKNHGAPYELEVGRTLMVSGVGLMVILATIFGSVVMNEWWMTRKLGVGLIAAYCVVLAINVTVEITLGE